MARFGDNMRSVAVTEGDKVAAQAQFGFSVNGYGLGDLVAVVNQVSDGEIDALVAEYEQAYRMAADLRAGGARHASIREAARIEIGLASFLSDGGFTAFTTSFEDLHGLAQLPGLAVQRLMEAGYGFGAEGDWKTAALLRSLKVMAEGLDGGASFMEDYTYHFQPGNMAVLGAHMLEICPSIAAEQPSLEVHALGIGGKADPARLVFNTGAGAALNASLIDLGDRFRMIVNTVEVIEPDAPLPKLPVARALWRPHPNLAVGAAAWIYAGGAHHTVFSQALRPEHIYDFSEMAGVEHVQIDESTEMRAFKNELRWNEMAYKLGRLESICPSSVGEPPARPYTTGYGGRARQGSPLQIALGRAWATHRVAPTDCAWAGMGGSQSRPYNFRWRRYLSSAPHLRYSDICMPLTRAANAIRFTLTVW